ncbi:metabotropic glutamate receptor B isoform X2 [Andrena cerasifolii]|uniref:metabotropic glutamate receptor B isoform X2 n=1 Tax=Andrena cerasifolii TaxID=2819439 RepID=UPI004037DC2E
MRRNNCWLAVLAVSTVLPILRNGLAGERSPVDYENVELRGNRSKAAHEARGYNQAAPSTQPNDETYPISQDMVAKQPLEASQTSYFPRSKEERRSLAKEASIPGVSTDAIPWQTSTNLDTGPSKGKQLWLSPVRGSIPTNTVSLPQEEPKLIDGFSEQDPLERSNKFHPREQAAEATKRSFTQIPRTILASATSGPEIRGGRRLSPWISRGAIKDSSGQANDVIHRVSGGRNAGASRSEGEEGAPARGKNQWGTSAIVLGHPYYGHVARTSRDDGALTTTRGDAGKVVGFVENRPVVAGTSGTADAGDSFSEIHARHGDIGSPASSGDEAREQTVEQRSSRMDVIGDASTKGAAGPGVESAEGIFTADGNARGRTAAEFLGIDVRLRDKRNNELMRERFALVNGTLLPRGLVKGPEEIQGNKVAEDSPDEARTVITRETSVSMSRSKSKADRREDSKRGSVSRKSEAARRAEGTHEPCGVSSKQRSTANSDDGAENSGFRTIQRENRAAISAPSVTISIHSVPDSTEHPASAREKGKFVGCRDTLASDASSEGSRPRKNEEILPREPDGSRVPPAGAAGQASNNETVDGENFNSDASGEVTSAVHDGKDARDTSGNRSNYTASPEGYKVPSERLIQTVAEWRSEDDEQAAIKIPPMEESTTGDATKESENAPLHSLPGSIGATKNSTYLRRDTSSLAEGSFEEKTIDPSVSRFSGKNARAPFRNSDDRSVTKGARKYTENSKGDVRVDQLSKEAELDPGVLSLIPSKRGIGVTETVVVPEDGGERSAVNYPSDSLVEHRDAENYGERGIKFDEELNSSPTNGPVIVIRGGGNGKQDLLNESSRASSDEVDDNEAASGFASRSAQAKGVHGSLDNGPPGAVNPFVRGEKNVEDHPAAARRAFRSSLVSRNPKQGSISESGTLDSNATSRPIWTNAGKSVTVPSVTSPRIDSMPRALETGIPRVSNALDRPTEFVARLEDRSTVTSGLYETDIGAGTTSSGSDVPLRTTNSSQLGVEASIVSSADDERMLGAVASVASSENDGVSLATVEDASPRNTDNSSHDLEPVDPLWPVKHSAVVEGDLVLGGLMMVHEREDTVTCGPVMPQGGVQALEAMLYTLDRLNDRGIVPGVKIGAHILDDCDKDTYGLEMAVDFIKGSISNIDGAEYHCNKTAVRKVISGVVGAASSVTSIQVANLLRLFRIPQVSFFSTSPELSNKQRFEYFTRTIPSDHYQVKAMVDIVLTMKWSYVSIIYEESNYGIKAFEELEELLGKYNICIAIKEKLVKDSGVAEETAYDNIVLKLLTKPRARGCIIFGSDQEVAGVMRAVRRCNATGVFSWIGSDGWSARGLVSNGNEPEVEGTLSVQPQANPVKGFEEYFLNLTVENNRRNPWFVEFWEDHFKCRYPNASATLYNQKYTRSCTTKERLTKEDTAFEDQLQFVSDAVMAFAYAFRDMHRDLCHGKPGLCETMKPTKGTQLLQYLRKVDFEGLSGDKFKFDKNGDGPARYNIIHFKQTERGKYEWVRVEIQFQLEHPKPPESVCSLACEVGQAKKYVEGERCCWHCFNCTQYQIRHPKDETQCIACRQGTVPDETHSTCRDIPEEFLRTESAWAIGAMSFSSAGILITMCVCGVFLKHNDTPVVRASGRELSYVLLSGILLCYLVTFALVLRPTDIVCGIQRFAAGFCFTVVYAALLTKTNRISRIFNASTHSAKRPSFISPRSQLIICSGLVFVQILINGVWMIIDPARAMHHYPTREDNLLVCNSYIDASYMIAFAYPIMLIVVCTVYAVLTRKIPEAFNESKHIGFTMYTTCVIWLAFVPLYFGTGNNVALRITSMSVTISLSASVTIACLFSPKLYIILIRPERNVRQSMMPARYSTTKSSAVTATNASSMIAPITLTAATCDQNKTVKKHIITTIDCSTQSEYFELEVKDQKNGKPQPAVVSRSTQTSANSDKDSVVASKDSKETSTTTKQLNNNARIGNGPVNQTDVSL